MFVFQNSFFTYKTVVVPEPDLQTGSTADVKMGPPPVEVQADLVESLATEQHAAAPEGAPATFLYGLRM